MKRNLTLLKLLLMRERDGADPEELKEFSEKELVYHLALGIQAGYIEGETLQDADGNYVAAATTGLTFKGHDYLEALELERTAPEYFTCIKSAATYANKSERTIRSWIKNDWLKCERRGKKIRIKLSDLDACARRQ